MLLKTDIAILALGRLGSTLSVINLDVDTSTQAKAIRKHFETSLKTLLELYPWNFATKFAKLALVEDNPQPAWGYSYRLPDDCLVLRKIADSALFFDRMEYEDQKRKWIQAYDVSGKLIYSNIGNAYGEYTVDVPDDSAFPTHFGRGLSAQLALDIAPFIITNNFSKVKQVLVDDAKLALSQSMAIDISMQPLQEASDSPFLRARL